MKLDFFDAYNIRARLSSSVIFLSPVAISLFLCFEELQSFALCSSIVFVVLAFSNYIPIMQRKICKKNLHTVDYAANMLMPQDATFDEVTKERYYNKLVSLSESFAPLINTNDSERTMQCCKSAVLFLRNRTRNNQLVQEENINYGFCKNLLASKTAGIIICFLTIAIVVFYSLFSYDKLSTIPTRIFLAFLFDLAVLIFWVFGINQAVLEDVAKRYAKTLVSAIDAI